MPKQDTFAGSGFEKSGRMTRRERFLNEMDKSVPWVELLEVIEPHYPKEPVPDETTVMRFRHLLEEYDLGRELLETINGVLRTKGLLLQKGAIVDATVINAPGSTKNASAERDPEMHQTKKGERGTSG